MQTGTTRRVAQFVRLRAAGAVLVVAGLAVGTAHAADPFSLRLLRQGSDALNRRDYATATRQLRLAVFGLLDEPELLADGLTRLALAQAGRGDLDGFRETFQRIAEIEERFGAYSKAAITSEVRKVFEQEVVRNVPPETLAGSPAFARLAPKPEDPLFKLSPSKRRKELESRIDSEPKELKWRFMLAELELAEREDAAARAAADGALKLTPDNKDALRIRGLAWASDKKWSQAADDLTACGAAAGDPRVAEALVRSLVELKRYQAALDVLALLPKGVQRERRIANLAKAAAEGVKASQPAPTPTPKPAASTAPRSTATTPAAAIPRAAVPVPARTPTEQEAKILQQAQDLARQSKPDEAFTAARQIADAKPDLVEAQRVAAELAYLSARWKEAVAYFQRGNPGDTQPNLVFYYAVSLFETGDRAGAQAALKRCLSSIRRTPYVEEYARKILGGVPARSDTANP